MNKLIILFAFSLLFLSSCSGKKTSNLPNDFSQNKDKFLSAIEYFQKANQISSNINNLSLSEQKSKEPELINYLKTGIQMGNEVNDDFLNYLDSNLPFYFRNKLIESNKLYLEGISSKDLSTSSSIQKQIYANQLLTDWSKYWNDKYDKINKNIKSDVESQKGSKSIWKMILRFVISDFIAVIIFSFYLMLFLIPIYPLGFFEDKISKNTQSVITFSFVALAGIAQLYYWVLWSAYCAYTVQYYMNSPEVIYSWLYYLIGFFAATGPIGYLSSKEQKLTTTNDENKNVQKGTFYYSLLAVIMYIVFLIWPDIMNFKYISWLNNFLY